MSITAASPLGGSFSARASRTADVMGQRVTFDGTSLGLTQAALRVGARAGDVIQANFGLGAERYVITHTGGGDRTPQGRWVTRESASQRPGLIPAGTYS